MCLQACVHTRVSAHPAVHPVPGGASLGVRCPLLLSCPLNSPGLSCSPSVCTAPHLSFPFLLLSCHFILVFLSILLSFCLPSAVSPTPSHTMASPDLMPSIWKSIYVCVSPTLPAPTPRNHLLCLSLLPLPTPCLLFLFLLSSPTLLSVSLFPFLCICCSSDPPETTEARPNVTPSQDGVTLLISQE